jgi:hypothetical protein
MHGTNNITSFHGALHGTNNITSRVNYGKSLGCMEQTTSLLSMGHCMEQMTSLQESIIVSPWDAWNKRHNFFSSMGIAWNKQYPLLLWALHGTNNIHFFHGHCKNISIICWIHDFHQNVKKLQCSRQVHPHFLDIITFAVKNCTALAIAGFWTRTKTKKKTNIQWMDLPFYAIFTVFMSI